MEESTTRPVLAQSQASPEHRRVSNPEARSTSRLIRYAVPATLLLALVAALISYQIRTSGQTTANQPAAERISAGELEERYGLRVHLIGVTAGGGMIDFRLKIVDAEKARHFLKDPANLPRLIVAETGAAPVAPEGMGDDINWDDGGILFTFFLNSGGAIEPGTPVIVEFGGVQLGPIPAQ